MIFFVIKPKPHINGISKAGFSDEVWLQDPKLMDFMRTNNTSHYSGYASIWS